MLRAFCAVLLFFAVNASAQTGLTPAQIAYLNQLFASAKENSLPGLWLVNGSVTAGKLAPAVMALINAPETDPVFIVSAAHSVSAANIISWNTAVGWGNHASAGYLTSYTETDPVHTAWRSSLGPLFSGVVTSAYWNGAAWATNRTYYTSGMVSSNVVTP